MWLWGFAQPSSAGALSLLQLLAVGYREGLELKGCQQVLVHQSWRGMKPVCCSSWSCAKRAMFCPVKNPDRPGAKFQQPLLLGWLCHKRLVHFTKNFSSSLLSPFISLGRESVLPVTAAVPGQLQPFHPPCIKPQAHRHLGRCDKAAVGSLQTWTSQILSLLIALCELFVRVLFLIHHQLTWAGNKKTNLPSISPVQWAHFFKPSAPLSFAIRVAAVQLVFSCLWTLLESSGHLSSPTKIILSFTHNKQNAPGPHCASPAPLWCRTAGACALQCVLRGLFTLWRQTHRCWWFLKIPSLVCVAAWGTQSNCGEGRSFLRQSMLGTLCLRPFRAHWRRPGMFLPSLSHQALPPPAGRQRAPVTWGRSLGCASSAASAGEREKGRAALGQISPTFGYKCP